LNIKREEKRVGERIHPSIIMITSIKRDKKKME